MSKFNTQIKSQNILIVEGNDERDLSFLLLKELGFNCFTQPERIENIENAIQIINLNGLTDNLENNKNKIQNIIDSSNIELKKLVFFIDAEEKAEERFNIVKDYIKCNYDSNTNIFSYDNHHLFLSTYKNDKTKGSLEDIVLEVILEIDKELYENCVNNFFNCSNDYLQKSKNDKNDILELKAKILAFISVKCRKRNSIGGLFQDCRDYLNAEVLSPLKDFLCNAFK